MYKEAFKQNVAESKVYGEALASPMEGFALMHKKVMEDKVLDTKTKELIAVAIAVVIRCEGCILHHVKALLSAGGSREELVECLGVAMLMGGGPATAYGSKALAWYDELLAEKN